MACDRDRVDHPGVRGRRKLADIPLPEPGAGANPRANSGSDAITDTRADSHADTDADTDADTERRDDHYDHVQRRIPADADSRGGHARHICQQRHPRA